MFDLNTYIKSQIWENNQFLVQHPTGIKRCECCNKLWYSQEYPESNEFVDGKYPICGFCSKKKKKQDKIHKLVLKYGIFCTCKKCKEDKSVSYFISRQSDWTTVNTNCDTCRVMPKIYGDENGNN